MALKTGLTHCMQTALRLVQPVLSTSFISGSQRCHLWTSKLVPCISSNVVGLQSANQISIVHAQKKTLSPLPLTLNIVHVRNYHSALRPQLHCKGCYFVWRHGRKYVECSDVPSHKQMKKVIKRKLWKEDYTQGNMRKAMDWNRDMMRISDRRCDRNVLSHNWLASRIGRDV